MSVDYICPLCEAKPITRRYYETSLFWIADCATCKVPMVVLNEHQLEFTQSDMGEIMKVVNKMFDMTKCEIDSTRRQIPGHAHFHIRPKKVKKIEKKKPKKNK